MRYWTVSVFGVDVWDVRFDKSGASFGMTKLVQATSATAAEREVLACCQVGRLAYQNNTPIDELDVITEPTTLKEWNELWV